VIGEQFSANRCPPDRYSLPATHCRVILSEFWRVLRQNESKDLRLLLLLHSAQSQSNGNPLFYSLFPVPCSLFPVPCFYQPAHHFSRN
jgi:hypothetical protein